MVQSFLFRGMTPMDKFSNLIKILGPRSQLGVCVYSMLYHTNPKSQDIVSLDFNFDKT